MKKYEEKYEENETALRSDLGDDVPQYSDWQCVKNLLKFVKYFCNMTMRVFGSQYVTSNTFFSEIAELFYLLNDWKKSDDVYVRPMGLGMKSKLDKYYGDGDKMNYMIFILHILDPRDKLEYLEFSLKSMYGDYEGVILFENVKAALYELFYDYNTTS